MVYLFLATGFEETEALAPADMLRRAGVALTTVSITGDRLVTSSHNFPVMADALFEDLSFDDAEMLILPGGMPGSKNLKAHEGLRTLLVEADKRKVWLGAICAAPMVFGDLGLLQGRKATCYPGFEGELRGATHLTEKVVRDGHILTACGAGAAILFGIELVRALKGDKVAEDLLDGICGR